MAENVNQNGAPKILLNSDEYPKQAAELSNQQPTEAPSQNQQEKEVEFGTKSLPQVGIRTMKSDIEALRAGEINPEPISVLPSEIESGQSVFTPETKSYLEAPAGKPRSKKWPWIIATLILVGIAAALGYFFILPQILQPQKSPTTPPVVPATPDNKQPPAVQPPSQSLFIHAPLLAKTGLGIKNVKVNFEAIDPMSIKRQLAFAADSNQLPKNLTENLLELEWEKGTESLMSYGVLPILVPFLSLENVKTWFDKDFWSFLYINKKGNWPVYMFKLNLDVNRSEVGQRLLDIEKSASQVNFYITDPGVFKPFNIVNIGNWQFKSANGALSGSSFTYGFLGSYAIFSTSLDGIKFIAVSLGLL